MPKDVAGFEAEQAIARMMDNTELWWRALAIFHAHYEHWEDTWRGSQAEFAAERKCIHALRSAAANVGADRLAAAAAALENALLHAADCPQNLTSLRAHVLASFLEVRQSTQEALGSSDGSVKP